MIVSGVNFCKFSVMIVCVLWLDWVVGDESCLNLDGYKKKMWIFFLKEIVIIIVKKSMFIIIIKY